MNLMNLKTLKFYEFGEFKGFDKTKLPELFSENKFEDVTNFAGGVRHGWNFISPIHNDLYFEHKTTYYTKVTMSEKKLSPKLLNSKIDRILKEGVNVSPPMLNEEKGDWELRVRGEIRNEILFDMEPTITTFPVIIQLDAGEGINSVAIGSSSKTAFLVVESLLRKTFGESETRNAVGCPSGLDKVFKKFIFEEKDDKLYWGSRIKLQGDEDKKHNVDIKGISSSSDVKTVEEYACGFMVVKNIELIYDDQLTFILDDKMVFKSIESIYEINIDDDESLTTLMALSILEYNSVYEALQKLKEKF